MNYILGNGLIGLLAHHILKWPIISFKKSRFYSYWPPLADDHIVYDRELEPILGLPSSHFHKVMCSSQGNLYEPDQLMLQRYVRKIYGCEHPAVMDGLKTTAIFRMSSAVLYRELFKRYRSACDARRQLLSIDNHQLKVVVDGQVQELLYDRLISTIPLNALLDLLHQTHELESIMVHYTRVKTDCLDLEGANEVLVVDENIPFFKVIKITSGHYVFWSLHELSASIMGMIMERGDIISKTKTAALCRPSFNLPDLENDIICVGSCAQWDDRMDVSSCLKRILKISTGT